MRSTRCKDGKRRILTKIEVPMDVEAIAGFAWSAVLHDEISKEWASRNNPTEKIKGMNKREILRLAKKTVKTAGTGGPTDYPADVLLHVKKCFPEVD